MLFALIVDEGEHIVGRAIIRVPDNLSEPEARNLAWETLQDFEDTPVLIYKKTPGDLILLEEDGDTQVVYYLQNGVDPISASV